MKILVTGATGHLGRQVVHRLASAGHAVFAVSRSGKPPEPPYAHPPISVATLAADVAEDGCVDLLAEALGPGGVLVHLAAWHPPATAATTLADRRRLIEVNTLGSMRAFEAAKKAKASAVIYASTFEVYGNVSENPITERTRVNPLTDYGATKLSGEDHLCSLTAEEGIRGVSLRMPAIYGPGEVTSRALPNFLRAVSCGEYPVIAGDGADTRDQLHVRDAALAIELAVKYGGSGIFNIADGEEHSILKLARTALKVAGMDGEPRRVARQKERRDYHMRIDLAARELGFQPQVRLEDGMKEQLGWLRSLGG
ncbi:MAG: NAD(P)-dependent oxidoreductase [Myxococcales bacterium]|nr:NAD(P)-dependent oxidoreductase [Polyangiaceae bacterium]MDW8249426.1 NAD(P)-dependent oxidoreductase [Myxococcales bacterium]